MRGRLLFRFLAEVAQVDTAATEAAGGYSPVFKEPRVSYTGNTRAVARVERKIRIPCQVETTKTDDLRETPTGNAPQTMFRVVLHFRDLEKGGLVDALGRAKFRVNDRIAGIYRLNGEVQHIYEDPPGAYVTQVEPVGFGFGGHRNLVVLWCEDRSRGKLT